MLAYAGMVVLRLQVFAASQAMKSIGRYCSLNALAPEAPTTFHSLFQVSRAVALRQTERAA